MPYHNDAQKGYDLGKQTPQSAEQALTNMTQYTDALVIDPRNQEFFDPRFPARGLSVNDTTYVQVVFDGSHIDASQRKVRLIAGQIIPIQVTRIWKGSTEATQGSYRTCL